MLSISLVTKTHNRLPMLLECVQSVQNLRNEPHEKEIQWEHLIYDDGSDDDTNEHFAKNTYSNTRYVRSDIHRGISVSANAAIATCTSEYIFELDSDDIVPQRFLANLYDTIQEYPNTEWFVADIYRMGENRNYKIGDDYYGWNFTDCNEMLSAIFSNSHFIQHNVVYKKPLWEKVGGYDETLTMAEDLDLYIRFLLQESMPLHLPYISHFHRHHSENTSGGIGPEQHSKDIRSFFKKYEKPLKERGIRCS